MKTIDNHMDPDHYDEEWEPAAAEEEERKETAVERYIRSTEEVF